MIAVAVLAVVALATIIVFFYLKALIWPQQEKVTAYTTGRIGKSKIPGMPKSDPENGNLSDITAAGSFHEFLLNLHSKYGPVASFWYGSQYYVSLASPKAWKDHIKIFDRPPELFEFLLPLIGPRSIQYINGAEGKERRRTYDPSFSHTSIKNYYSSFQLAVDSMIEKISSLPAGEHIPLTEYMSMLTIKAVSKSTFGDFFKEDGKAVKLLHHYEIVMEVLNQKMADKVESQEKFNNVMVWSLYYLCQHQEIQEGVHNEILGILGKDGKVDHSNLDQLPYIKRVFNESMRCSVLAPFAARVNYEEDVDVQGYTIPKGTSVIHALGVVLQDVTIWPDPDRFDPDRFLPENVAKRHKLAHSPFGFAGKRICPGYRIAYAEGAVFLASLLQQFKFKLVEGQDIHRKFGFVTLPSDEVWVTVLKRE
ncbi:cytochrome P450 20A1-like isoform X2 [Ptychodera flava]|uniref:cytochrome P450 20A1-like isoform X2 n=1 Tax=Ptychodera flava TaxID=63121 RepID=UPI003969C6A1